MVTPVKKNQRRINLGNFVTRHNLQHFFFFFFFLFPALCVDYFYLTFKDKLMLWHKSISIINRKIAKSFFRLRKNQSVQILQFGQHWEKEIITCKYRIGIFISLLENSIL